MPTKHLRDDVLDEDDYEIIDGKPTLKDGHSVRFRMTDGADPIQRAVRAHLIQHQPNFIHIEDADGARQRARDEYIRGLNDSWRHPAGLVTGEDGQLARVPDTGQDETSIADARQSYIDWLTSAYRGRT